MISSVNGVKSVNTIQGILSSLSFSGYYCQSRNFCHICHLHQICHFCQVVEYLSTQHLLPLSTLATLSTLAVPINTYQWFHPCQICHFYHPSIFATRFCKYLPIFAIGSVSYSVLPIVLRKSDKWFWCPYYILRCCSFSSIFRLYTLNLCICIEYGD